jgi:hypothetical protein
MITTISAPGIAELSIATLPTTIITTIRSSTTSAISSSLIPTQSTVVGVTLLL